MPRKKSIWSTLNIVLALMVFSLFTGLLIFGAVFDFLDQWKVNPYVASIALLIGAVVSLIYLVWALLNWRLSKKLR